MEGRPQQRERAETLRRLHQGPRILVLPNVWDVVSARIVEASGFAALATTSAGVAFALGYPDGERISRAEMAAAVRRIAARVRVPVTADMEARAESATERMSIPLMALTSVFLLFLIYPAIAAMHL